MIVVMHNNNSHEIVYWAYVVRGCEQNIYHRSLKISCQALPRNKRENLGGNHRRI